MGDWKLIYFHASGKLELYNLRDDLSETKDLAEAQPQKLRELASTLTKFLQVADAQMPTDDRTGKPVPLPEAAVN